MSQDKMMLTAVFRHRDDAERALHFLYMQGYSHGEVNVLMSDKTKQSIETPPAAESHEAGNLAAEGLGVGGAIGTAVGATLGAVAAVGTTLALPGLGLVIAGPVAAALAGGGAGAVTGGLIGALIGSGMSEQSPDAYHNALRHGGVVIGVVPNTQAEADVIQQQFRELGGEYVCYC
jgi:hypothetical protein